MVKKYHELINENVTVSEEIQMVTALLNSNTPISINTITFMIEKNIFSDKEKVFKVVVDSFLHIFFGDEENFRKNDYVKSVYLLIETMIKNGFNVNTGNYNDETILNTIISLGYYKEEFIRLILDNGVDITIKDDDGYMIIDDEYYELEDHKFLTDLIKKDYPKIWKEYQLSKDLDKFDI